MSQSQDDESNQSQSIKKSSDNDDTRFFTEVHLLASKLVLVVAIHSLGSSRVLTPKFGKKNVGIQSFQDYIIKGSIGCELRSAGFDAVSELAIS